ncbi:MAG: flagellin lysine-N-methylase [Dorea sp.]|nr:flagellin lysine-N-methylase [Dorea sp.]
MRIVKPTFYDRFVCIADACDFTCCQEWKIAVDDETYKKWKKVKPPQGVKTRKTNLTRYTCFKEGQRVIDLDQNHKCPFLDEHKLCRLVREYGEDMISETCQIFPREIHEFEDGKEYTLMPCCPVTVDFLSEGRFETIECQTPEATTECQTPEESTGCQIPEASTRCQTPEESTGCQTQEAGTECQTQEAGTECQTQEASTECQTQEASTECQTQEASTGNLKNLRGLRKVFMEIQGNPDFSLEEALLTNFYLMLDEFKQWEENYDENLPEDEIMPYQMFHSAEELLFYSHEIQETIKGLTFDDEACFGECNNLFLDLIDNYRIQHIYDGYLQELAAFAEEFINEKERFNYHEFKGVWSQYENLMRNFLLQELYADLLIPGADLEGALVKLQWISMEYVAIRHLCFLSYKLKGSLDYNAVRDYIVLVSRIMGYEEDDIYDYLESMFEDLVWDWGYMALIVGK